MEIAFHGAAGGVTGSSFLLVAHGKQILVDCGLFQGGPGFQDENAEPYDFDPAESDRKGL